MAIVIQIPAIGKSIYSQRSAVQDIPIPFHPGAAAYYEEAGVSIGK